jgi:hypothetical protein
MSVDSKANQKGTVDREINSAHRSLHTIKGNVDHKSKEV